MSLAISSATTRLAACSCGVCAACAARPVMRAVSTPVAEPSSRAGEDRYEPSGQVAAISAVADDAVDRDATVSDGAAAERSTAGDISTSQKSDTSDSAEDSSAEPSGSTSAQQLSADERRMISELQARDRAVRAHEAAHQAAGGGNVGGASYSYQQGPDGRQYAIGGEVPVDMSTSGGSPEAVIAKMAQVRAAAMAPADPSPQDFAVAAAAAAIAASARQEQRAAQNTEATTQTTAVAGDAQASTVTGADGSQPAERQAGDDSASGSASKDTHQKSTESAPRLLGATPERDESTTATGSGTRSANDARPAGRAVNAYRAAQAGAGAASQIDQRA